MSKLWTSMQAGGGRRWQVFAALGLVAALVVGLTLHNSVVAETRSDALARVEETGKAFTEVTKKVEPAVVFIKATKQIVPTASQPGFGDLQGQIPDELLKRFFGGAMPPMQGPQMPQPAVGNGSGFIISQDGHILTNNHVVGNADKLEVTLHDGRVLDARLIGTDKRTDVAIIKVDAQDLPTLPMGDSDAIEVGEWVLAVGSPFGLSGTVTSGIVSAKGRDGMGITDYEEFIQTDAAINPGNSGGPLVNLRGEAIGINTAILSRTGAYNGIGFAIPMNMAREICQQLMEKGTVTRGFLGVAIQPLTQDLAESFQLKTNEGVLIADVNAGGPAEKAGLQRGDVVVQLDGKPVTDMTSFRNRIAMLEPGKQAKLEVMRDGQAKTISVELGKLDSDTVASVGGSSETTTAKLGLSVQTLDKELAEKLGAEADKGVVITQVQPGSAAAAQGLRPGMVIVEVDHQAVQNAEQFSKIVQDHQDAGTLLMLVQQGEHTRYVVLKLEK